MRFNLRHVILTLIFGSFALAATQSDLETAFEQNYEPSQSVVESAENAVFSLENANSAYLPRFTLSETLQAVNYQTVSLQASLGATWNILDAKRDLQRQISELQIKFANLEKTSDKDRARLNFRT